MNHPLVRTTEAFLIQHLQLSTNGNDAAGSGVKSGGKGDAKGGQQRQNRKSNMAVGKEEEGKGHTPTTAVEPNIVLFISLSGGKISLTLTNPPMHHTNAHIFSLLHQYLSVGVDSMVISKILRLLQLHRPQLRIKSIQAMHIDYGNRPESAEEAAFVMRWSHGEIICKK